MAHAKAKLELDQVVSTLIDKFQQLTIEERQLKASENALATTKGHGKPQACGGTSNTTKTDIECWKCSKKGHMKADYHSKSKKREKRRKRRRQAIQ